MAIIQISRITHRRGLQENLPQNLASAELGWALDTRKLYIGNGDISEGAPSPGNTEILTEHSNVLALFDSYTFQGQAAGYVVQTGPSPTSPGKRTLQDRLDDEVNLRDFCKDPITTLGDNQLHGFAIPPTLLNGSGTYGPDNVENPVDIINRAIKELYNHTPGIPVPQVRRTLIIPAGTYLLYGDFVRLMPYVRLKGEGKNSTYLVQVDTNQPCALSTADYLGTTGFNWTNAANVSSQTSSITSAANDWRPGRNNVEDITIITQNTDTVKIDSAAYVTFNDVGLGGTLTGIINSGANSAVKFGSQQVSKNIVFNNCDFFKQQEAINATNNVNHIVVNGGSFTTLYRGVDISGTVSSVRITNALFDGISDRAIFANNVSYVTSAFNTFNTVGEFPTKTTIVDLDGSSCYSIGDAFTVRTITDPIQAISLKGKASFATLDNGQLLLGTKVEQAGFMSNIALTTANATPTVAGIVGYGLQPTVVDYSIVTAPNQRSGSIKIANNGTSVIFDDDYVETNDTGVTLGATLTSGNLVAITYTTTSIPGATATLNLASRAFVNQI